MPLGRSPNQLMTQPEKQVAEELSRTRMRSFQALMPHRVQRILFVSSLYDCFIMSEEGHLHETLLSHFQDLGRNEIPDLLQVTSWDQALEHLRQGDAFDLIVTTLSAGDSDAVQFAHEVRALDVETPVMGLAYTGRELHEFMNGHDTSVLEQVFLWQGDVRILMAMVLCLEDRQNAASDTVLHGVPAILVVEDSVRFYSSFLPEIYSELFRHTHRLLSEELNLSQQIMRMRARPKVLLCTTFEEGEAAIRRYEAQIIGVLSDFEFPRDGELNERAGLDLCKWATEKRPNLRIVMQSSEPANRELAETAGASFLLKGSPHLLQQLRSVLVDRFGFGDFVFRNANHVELDRAVDLEDLGKKLATIPIESLVYHASNHHFSNWLKARTEFKLAESFWKHESTCRSDESHLRSSLTDCIARNKRERARVVISNFDRKRFDPRSSLTRIGRGALGGKARGLAFANRILHDSGLDDRYPDVNIEAPPAGVLGTEVFDEFMQYGDLREMAMACTEDAQLQRVFLDAPLPREAASHLRSFLQRVKYPLAIRSSSLLEDSLSQPFAGVYQTHMLANNDPDLETRLRQLSGAIKRVYASTFEKRAKSYLDMTDYRLEEEKMAVMIQELVGASHGDRFYPDFSGVARSYSYYPEPGHKPEDGVCAVALGMGRAVVGGAPCLQFSPTHPKQLVTFSSPKDALSNSQRNFWAVNLERNTPREGIAGMELYPLEAAEEDGTLTWLGSTFTAQDNRIVDGISRPGVRLVSFAQILKHEAFPLASLLRDLLELCSAGTGSEVEIEFAGSMQTAVEPARFAFLQLRPLAKSREEEPASLEGIDESRILCRSDRVLGNGIIDSIEDIVCVVGSTFDRQRTPEIAQQVAHFDAILRKQKRPYLLVGSGRWGSSDPHLGIPVGWEQIAGARVILEAGLPDLRVEPSQGAHFFQNLTSSRVGYFTVNQDFGQGSLDWSWLEAQEAAGSTEFVRHIRLTEPLSVLLDGESGEGVVLRPA